MSEILVGLDGTAGAEDALAFARRLADATGATLRLASSYPYEEWQSRTAANEYGEFLRQDARAMLERYAGDRGDVPTHAIADRSPARALDLLAAQTGAALVVVGSTHRGPVGRVMPGSTAERLLHGAACPVAIVPHGYRNLDDPRIATIGVGYDGSDESESALAAAHELARRFGATLRIIRVFDAAQVGTPTLVSGPGYVAGHKEVEAMLREHLEQAAASLPPGVPVETVFVAGAPSRELAAQSKGVDLMLMGSRGYGPVRAVLLGGVAHALVRNAECPVIVLPRGVRGALDELLQPAAESTV